MSSDWLFLLDSEWLIPPGSNTKAYSIVRDLNKELEDKGYLIIPGRVSRKYFEERFYGVEQDTVKEERHASE